MSQTRKKGFFTLPVLLGLLALGCLAIWTVYWFYGAGVVRQGAREWIEDQQAMGRSVEYSALNVTGYPYRFVLQADDPVIDAPDMQARWEGEKLQLVAMAWNFNHVIARSPGQNDFDLPDGQTFSFSADDSSAASFVWEDGNLRRVGLELPTLDAVLNESERYTLTNGSIGLRPMPDEPRNLQLAVSFNNLSLPEAPEGAEWLGREVSELVIWGEIENFFSVIEDGLTVTEWKLDENRIELVRGDLDMGPLDLSMRANVKLDRNNDPDGTVSLFLERSEDLISALREAGSIDPQGEAIINAVAQASSNGTPLTVQVKERSIRLFGQTLAEY